MIIYKIIKSVEDRQSRLAWQTVNEVSKKKSLSRGKLKAASQEERVEVERTFQESARKHS